MAAGSGAGSEVTELAECAQAFVCAILDYFSGPGGKNTKIIDSRGNFKRYDDSDDDGVIPEKADKNFNYYIFSGRIKDSNNNRGWKNNVKKLVKISKSIGEIEKFLNAKKDWFVSSINIAESLQREIKKRLNGWDFSTHDYFHYRDGGKNAIMVNISEIFGIVNKKNENYFANINRWCPADIYIGKTEGEREVKKLLDTLKNGKPKVKIGGKEIYPTFESINYIFRYLVQRGYILPISLKKNGTRFQVVPIKMFNSGPPMTSVSGKGRFRSDSVTIKFDSKYIDFSEFYSSMDMYIKASNDTAEELGYRELKIQIRDKGASSSNRIFFERPNTSWKFGIQASSKFVPSAAQAGGIGAGPLERMVGLTNPLDLNKKTAVSGIASKICWKKTGFYLSTELSKEEEEFIDLFQKKQSIIQSKTQVNFQGASIPQGDDTKEKLYHCLEQLNIYNSGTSKHPGVKGKLKKNKIQPRDRYLVARWFFTKYYCIVFAEEVSKSGKKKNLENVFKACLSMDKGSGKGDGSLFFVKAG